MRSSVALQAIVVAVAMSSFGWVARDECRADTSLADLFPDDKTEATLTMGGLTYTFDKSTVLSSGFPSGSGPTLSTVFVSVMKNGITFTFNPAMSVSGQTPRNYDVTITYSVTSTFAMAQAYLSFSASVPQAIGESSNPLSSASVEESLSDGVNLKVSKVNDMNSVTTTKNPAVASLADTPMALTVTNTANVSIPGRGGPGTSAASITSITNVFSVPEPSSFVVASAGALFGLAVWRRGRARGGPSAPR